ncbi:MAG: hypothetical protein N2654_03930 [Deltaproteobacteria bacterium]|nr:hypothetical protein [Deltaproteobacteria bacterium]
METVKITQILSVILTRLLKQKILVSEASDFLVDSCRVPCYLDKDGKVLVAGDLFIGYILISTLGLKHRLRYENCSELKIHRVFYITWKWGKDFFPHKDAIILLSEEILSAIEELSAPDLPNVYVPIFGKLFISRGNLMLEVNERRYRSIIFGENIMIEKPENSTPIKVDLILGTIEFTPQEYFNLRPGAIFKLENAEILRCCLKIGDVEIAECELRHSQCDGDRELVIKRLRYGSDLKDFVGEVS